MALEGSNTMAVNALVSSEGVAETSSAPARVDHVPARSSEDTTTQPFPPHLEPEKEEPGPGEPTPFQPLSPHRTISQPDAILALPPPPPYDVHVQDLSIAVPPFRAYIPTPIPIPIPTAVTNLFRKSGKRNGNDAEAGVSDGLIVRNVNAAIRSGEMCALIGGSGSGKTTLLHAIASRLGNLPIASGGVVISSSRGAGASDNPAGGHRKLKGLSKVLGFVRQNDFLLPHLTGERPRSSSVPMLTTLQSGRP
jgi:ABC-type multidrug transport system fused ATPase/permease subunit